MKNRLILLFILSFQLSKGHSQMYATGNGGSSMANCIVWGQPITLASTFLHFSVNCSDDKSYLQWSVSSTGDTCTFMIQRSTDHINFQDIAVIHSKESPGQPVYYSYVDNVATGNSFYYRIKEVSYSGRFIFSPIVSSSCGGVNKTNVLLYPNPTNGTFNISSADLITDITIKNLLGQTVFYKKINGNKAVTTMDNFSPGVYFVIINSIGATIYRSFILRKK